MPAPGALAIVACLAAALWAPPARAQTIIDLGTLPCCFVSRASGINAHGQVVGEAVTQGGESYAFLYSNGVMTDLGTLPGAGGSTAMAINDSGQITGYTSSDTPFVYPRTFLYSDGVMTDLGTPDKSQGTATGINASGQVVGYWNSHAFLYSGGTLTDLAPGNPAKAYGINSGGQIVGLFWVVSEYHAFLYSNGVVTDLGTPPGVQLNYWGGINASGQIVTSAADPTDHWSAYLYSNGSWIALNSLLPAGSGWDLQDATAINDSGQITGYGVIGGQSHAFLLTQAPSLAGLGPSSVVAGGAAFTLTVDGANFLPSATVNWNGTALETTFVSGTQLTATVPASVIAMAGTASVTVTTTAGTLAGAMFTIHPPRGSPREPERPRRTGQEEGQ